MTARCVLCDYQPTTETPILYDWPDTFVIRPLAPVVPGHVLVIPKAHVYTAADEPMVTATTFGRAAMWPQFHGRDEAFNLITSVGPEATQTVFHLHVHYVPRHAGDGLALPWTREAAP